MPRCLSQAIKPQEETAIAEVAGIDKGFSWEKLSMWMDALGTR